MTFIFAPVAVLPGRRTRPAPQRRRGLQEEVIDELEKEIADLWDVGAAETAQDQGIHQGTIRLSIGLENIDDIIEDLESGFKALRESGLAK